MADSKQVERYDPFARRRSMAEAAEELFDDTAGVVIGDDGSMTFGAITLLPTGLKVAGKISESDWQKLVVVLLKMRSSLQFLIGDLLLYGAREYGRTYEEMAELFGYEIKTLQNFVYICARVKTSRHREKLSFSHCAVIAGIEDAPTRQQWLDYVLTLDPLPSVRALTAMIAGRELLAPRKGIEKLVYGAAQTQQFAEKLAASARKPAQRAQLRAFADEQVSYWQKLIESLEDVRE